jgi:hypothetical protein
MSSQDIEIQAISIPNIISVPKMEQPKRVHHEKPNDELDCNDELIDTLENCGFYPDRYNSPTYQ